MTPAARAALRLDHNERLVPAPELAALLPEIPATALTQYPLTKGIERRLARRCGVRPERVLVTAGADDAIDRICRLHLSGGRELVTVLPTFETLRVFAEAAGGRVRGIPTLEDPAPPDAIFERVSSRTGLASIISPHNPTGLAVPTKRFLDIADRLPTGAMLLADLAYAEFSDPDPTPALLERPNILVARTLSKAWGLAGLRVGYVMGSARAIAALRAQVPPFPLSGPSVWLAERALDLGETLTTDYVATVRRERDALRRTLAEAGLEAFPSEANFVLVRASDALGLQRGLRRRGIAVRRFDHSPELVRITLPGDADAFDLLLDALNAVLAGSEALASRPPATGRAATSERTRR